MSRLFAIFSGAPFHTTGGGQQPAQIARQLVAMGDRVVHYQLSMAPPGADTGGVVIGHVPFDLANEAWAPAVTKRSAAYWRGWAHALNNAPDTERWAIVCCPLAFFAVAARELKAAGWKVAYWLLDDWAEMGEQGYCTWYREINERWVLGLADAVFATAQALVEKAARLGREALLIPNGFDAGTFTQRMDSRLRGQGKQIVYWGCLNGTWLDWGIFEGVALARPDWTIHIIGGNPAKVIDLPNVVYHGVVDARDLAHYRADVGIIPFNPDALSRAVDPIKAYEYTALGMPTVACRMPQLDGWEGVTQARPEVRDWVAAIEAAKAGPYHRQLQGRSWRDRASRFTDALA